MTMRTLCQCPLIWLSGVLLIAGCGNSADVSKERLAAMAGGELKQVVPVSGTVLVDGAPTMGVNLYLYNEEGGAPLTYTRTDDAGKYCWSTYLQCDGLEPGNYRLGFEYIPKTRPKHDDEGEDLFKGKYKNPMNQDFKLTVQEGAPQEGVDYDLKLK